MNDFNVTDIMGEDEKVVKTPAITDNDNNRVPDYIDSAANKGKLLDLKEEKAKKLFSPKLNKVLNDIREADNSNILSEKYTDSRDVIGFDATMKSNSEYGYDILDGIRDSGLDGDGYAALFRSLGNSMPVGFKQFMDGFAGIFEFASDGENNLAKEFNKKLMDAYNSREEELSNK